jgi:molybdate/tungstate transport system permease protein
MSSGSDTDGTNRRSDATVSGRWPSGRYTLNVGFALLGAALIVFVVGPFAKLLLFSPAASVVTALNDSDLHAAIALTVASATLATVIGLVLGVPLAYLLARRRLKGLRWIESLLQVPGLVPHPVSGIALLLFLGRDTALGGALARLGLEIVNQVPGLVATMGIVSAPILIAAAAEAFRAVDPTLERVARSLGDTEWAAFRRVSLPLARRGIIAGGIVAWARAVSEFGAVVVVAYHPKVASVLIFDRLTTDGLRGVVPAASLLVVVGLALVAALFALNRRGAR